MRDKSARADKRCETELTGNKAGFRLESMARGMEMGFIHYGQAEADFTHPTIQCVQEN